MNEKPDVIIDGEGYVFVQPEDQVAFRLRGAFNLIGRIERPDKLLPADERRLGAAYQILEELVVGYIGNTSKTVAKKESAPPEGEA